MLHLCSFGTAFAFAPHLRPLAQHESISSSRTKAQVLRMSLTPEKKTTSKKKRISRIPKVVARRPSVESGLRYRSEDWLRNFLSLPNSFVMTRIWSHLISNTALAVLAAVLHHFRKWSIPMSGHSLMGGFLSLLLVFRTNSAYARFWEGRGAWAKTMATCRDLALCVVSHIQPHSPKSASKLMKLLAAFPDALSFSCLSETVKLPIQVKELIPQSTSSLVPAMAICLEMHKAIHAAVKESTTSATDYVEAMHLTEASHEINSLVSSLTSCEKIVRTPIPWCYSRHTSRFLTIWCGTLPFAVVGQLGWLAVPVVMTACWCLFAIEEIGQLIEQPFVGYAFEGEMSPLVRRGRKTQPYDIGLPVCTLAGEVRREVLDIAAAASS